HILSNLLSNAIKYSPNKTDIQVKLNCTKRDIIIQVQDSGIGISESDREHLFTPFYRGRNVTNIPGTGLGLAIISQCVELHGGSIEMTSQVNCGTLFIVKLPILNPDV
ncbi:MAG TPA: sensor histidine kinase, partial [Elainellaceae cyanobacterium]